MKKEIAFFFAGGNELAVERGGKRNQHEPETDINETHLAQPKEGVRTNLSCSCGRGGFGKKKKGGEALEKRNEGAKVGATKLNRRKQILTRESDEKNLGKIARGVRKKGVQQPREVKSALFSLAPAKTTDRALQFCEGIPTPI